MISACGPHALQRRCSVWPQHPSLGTNTAPALGPGPYDHPSPSPSPSHEVGTGDPPASIRVFACCPPVPKTYTLLQRGTAQPARNVNAEVQGQGPQQNRTHYTPPSLRRHGGWCLGRHHARKMKSLNGEYRPDKNCCTGSMASVAMSVMSPACCATDGKILAIVRVCTKSSPGFAASGASASGNWLASSSCTLSIAASLAGMGRRTPMQW
jgi:hypothetical protein